MIHLCDKMTNAVSRFIDVLIVVEVNFFLLQRSDESFGVSRSPKDTLCELSKSQYRAL